MKKLMIVGASMLQLPAILKAKEMGLNVAVVDYNPKAVGIQYADEYYNASTMDEDAVLDAAKQYMPDGILTLATDMPMRGVAKASDYLNLHSIPYATALVATDKFDMIKAFKEHGVPSPWFYVVCRKDDLYRIKDKLSYPCVMKPTDNAGSHGVVLANSFRDLVDSFDYSSSSVRKGCVIIEEYLDGDEVSVECMAVDGVVHVLQITDKLTTGAPHFVEMGHSQPTRHPAAVADEIRRVAVAACEAVGINKGPAHVEIMVTSRGPVMIELGARMGGDNITTDLVPLSTGIDMVGDTIRVALGEAPELKRAFSKGSAIRYFKVPFGRIESITGTDEAKAVAGVKQVVFTKGVGEESTPIESSNDRIGYVIAQGADGQDAVSICEKAMKLIDIKIIES